MNIDGVTQLNNSKNIADLNQYRSGQYAKKKPKTKIESDVEHYAKLESIIEPHYKSGGILSMMMRYMDLSADAADPIVSFSGTLSMCAALFGRRYEIEIQPGRGGIRSNLYVALLAVTGRGKDNPRRAAKEIFRLSNPDIVGGDSATSAGGLIHALEKYPSRLFMWDEFGDELRKIFDVRASEHKKAIADTLMKLFSSSNSVIYGPDRARQRKKSAEENQDELNKRRDLIEPNACLFGTSTQGQFFDALRRSSAASGFLNRMLIFNTPETWLKIDRDRDTTKIKGLRDEIATCLKGYESTWASIYQDYKIDPDKMSLTKAPVLPVSITLGAKRHIEHIQDVIVPINKIKSPIPAMWVRAVEMMAKIAMIFSLSKNYRNAVVELQDIENAWDLVDFLTTDAIRLFEDCIADNQTEANHKRVLSLIRQSGEMTSAELYRQSRYLKKQERIEIIDNLLESGDIAIKKEKLEGKRQSTTIYCAPVDIR